MCLAIPGKILSIEESTELLKKGKVDFGGIIKEVYLPYIPDVKIGDYVNVHAGFAISKINEDEANEIYDLLKGDLKDIE